MLFLQKLCQFKPLKEEDVGGGLLSLLILKTSKVGNIDKIKGKRGHFDAARIC